MKGGVRDDITNDIFSLWHLLSMLDDQMLNSTPQGDDGEALDRAAAVVRIARGMAEAVALKCGRAGVAVAS